MTSSLPTTKTSIGLGNVDNTSDANKPVSTAQQTALDLKENLANKGASSGYAPLDSSTKVPLTNLPVASSGSSSSLQVVRADDSRLSDARPPDFDTLNWSTNADYTTVATRSVIVRQTGTLTQTRTVNLPLANTLPAGSEVVVAVGSSVSSTINVTIARQGSDTINGSSSSITVAHPYAWRRFITDGSSSWVFDAGVLRSSNNLSDLSSVTTSMTNLSAGSTISGGSISSSNKITDQNAFSTYLHPVNTSFGESLPRWTPNNNISVASGTATATRIVCLKTGTLQFLSMVEGVTATNGTNGDADYRFCVWNSSGTLIGVSSNVSSALTSSSAASGTGWVAHASGGSNNQIFAGLTAVSGQSLAVNSGDVIYGGVAAYIGTGGSPVAAQWLGRTLQQAVTRYEPVMALAIGSGYAGGNPANLTATTSAFNISSTGTFNINRLGTTSQSSNVLYVAAW